MVDHKGRLSSDLSAVKKMSSQAAAAGNLDLQCSDPIDIFDSTAGSDEKAVIDSNTDNCNVTGSRSTQSPNIKCNKNSSKWNGKKNKKKKQPWYINRGEKKRLKADNCKENGDRGSDGEQQMNTSNEEESRPNLMEDSSGEKERPKNNRCEDEYDPLKTPHEGSFAHVSMQKLFGIHVDAPNVIPIDENRDEDGSKQTVDSSHKDSATGNHDSNNNTTKQIIHKAPKRKLALLISFTGTSYSGFQINSCQRTLQSEIELALYRSGLITFPNFGFPNKYSWSNSARTDKGVHAAAQVCSFKGLMIGHNGLESRESELLEEMREIINSFLPDDIRILDIRRVTRKFCARTNRDKVRYQYMFPSFLLSPQKAIQDTFYSRTGIKNDVAEETSTMKTRTNMTPAEASNIVKTILTPDVMDDAFQSLAAYRTNPQQMESLRNSLKVFEGTHSFHNYTRRLGAADARTMRYILSFEALDPVIVNPHKVDAKCESIGMEWIPIQITGQSFLLNQIRKMVSAAIDLARGSVSLATIEKSFSRECSMRINVAPAQGLFLDRSYFEFYNRKIGKDKAKSGNADSAHDHDTLDWVGEDSLPAVSRIEKFKSDKIIPRIINEEVEERNFLKYIFTQDCLYSKYAYGAIEGKQSRSSNNVNCDNESDGTDH